MSSEQSQLTTVPAMPHAAGRPGVAARSWLADAATRRALIRIVAYLALTRLMLFVVAASAVRIIPVGAQPRSEIYLGKNLSLAAWMRWDAWWYLSVVERGYWFDPTGKSNVAFFPVFPAVIKAIAALVGNPVIVGFVVANLAAVAAVVVFWRWVRAEAGDQTAERAVLWLLVYPFSFFFHTMYAESLFFLVATLALAAAGRGRWLSAGVWAGLGAATRPMGVLLAPAFAWGIWTRWRAGRRPQPVEFVAVVLPVVGLGGYAAYLWATVGDPWAFWKAHAVGWNVQLQWKLAGYWHETYWIVTRLPRVQAYTQLLDSLRVFLPLAFIALTVRAYQRLGAVPGAYSALAVAVAVLFAPDSVGRELLAAVPAFAALGLVTPGGSLGEGLRMCCLGLLIVFLFAFVTGHFVG